MDQLPDDALIVFAGSRGEILVTTNHDCIRVARRLREARVVYLSVVESAAEETMSKAIDWIGSHPRGFPAGRVLKVTRTTQPRIMNPIPWR